MIRNGAALFGAGMITNPIAAPFQQSSLNIFNIRDFGATGKKGENATLPVRNAVDACANAGGGVVMVPPGEYTVGTIQLKDNVTLHLEAGATFFLSQDQADILKTGNRTMIYAEKANNISITGKGTFDGLAKYEFVEMRGEDPEIIEEIRIAREAGIDMRRYYRTGMQTYMFVLNDCTNVLLQDVTLINTPLWNIRLNDCNRVFVRGIHIYSDLEKGVNSDGIDICSSSNVTISDSIIVTADDAIVLKTPSQRGKDKVNPVENIVVTNCILTSSSTALMIGTETFADIKHVIFSNCVIRNSNKGIGINVQDGATVSNIVYNNLTIETSRRHWNWWGNSEFCKFVLKKRSPESKLGMIRDIVVDNIVSHPRGTSTIKGHPEQSLENIRISKVQIFMEPEDAKDKRATDALVIESVNELKINDLAVKWSQTTEPKWKSALVLKNISEFEIRNFSGRQGLAVSTDPAILMENISEGLIAESRAEKGCDTFIRMKKAEKDRLVLRNNNTSKARREIDFSL
jgi:hypothetical protein